MLRSNHPHNKKKIKLYLLEAEQKWTEFLIGYLNLIECNSKNILQFKIQEIFNQLPQQFPFKIIQDLQQHTLLIPQELITSIQKSGNQQSNQDQQIIYLQLEHQGLILALSFINFDYCELIWEQLTLIREQNNDELTWSKQNYLLLCNELKQNPIYIDFLFGTKQKLTQFCKLYSTIKKNNPNQSLDNFFIIIKLVFLKADQNILKNILMPPYFDTILDCLSLNPFIDGKHHYLESYKSMTTITNKLQIQDKQILQAYQFNTRIKFVKDIAICMFTQPLTDAALNNIVSINNITILSNIVNSKDILSNLSQMAIKDPLSFFMTVTELWEIFKSLMEDTDTKKLKDAFYQSMIDGNFHLIATQIAYQLTDHNIPSRVYHRWIDSLPTLILYRWESAQKWLINKITPKVSLMQTLIKILTNADCHIERMVFQFIEGLIDPTDHLRTIKSDVRWHIFDEFVSKSFQICKSEDRIESYINFLIKMYQFDQIRSRRVIIEKDIMSFLSKLFRSKYIFIASLKLLRVMIEKQNSDMFQYMINRQIFFDIRGYYAQAKLNQNLLHASFMSLFKAAEKCQQNQTKKYISLIFFADSEDNDKSIGEEPQSNGYTKFDFQKKNIH